jgi:hypothetical protein
MRFQMILLGEQPLPVWQREIPKAVWPCNPRDVETVARRRQPPFPEPLTHCEPAFPTQNRQQTVLECVRRKGKLQRREDGCSAF